MLYKCKFHRRAHVFCYKKVPDRNMLLKSYTEYSSTLNEMKNTCILFCNSIQHLVPPAGQIFHLSNTLFLWRDTSKMNKPIPIKSAVDIRGTQKINHNDFGHPMTFFLAALLHLNVRFYIIYLKIWKAEYDDICWTRSWCSEETSFRFRWPTDPSSSVNQGKLLHIITHYMFWRADRASACRKKPFLFKA